MGSSCYRNSSLSVNQCQVFLPHNDIFLLQLFGVQIGTDGLTIWNELVVNYFLIILLDEEQHLVSGSWSLFNYCLCILGLQTNVYFLSPNIMLLKINRSHGFSMAFILFYLNWGQFVRYNSHTSVEVVKVMNYIALWGAELSWYSPSVIRQICRDDLEQGLRFYDFQNF